MGTIPASDIASGAALTKVDDTNVTLTLGGSPTTSLLSATSLTLGWSGTLAYSRFVNGAGLSVVGRSTNSAGVQADITAGSDFNILRRSGTSIGFGSIDLSQSGAVGSSILPVANGGTATSTAFTQGSTIFAGASGVYSQDNANYFWDATNHYLGIGNAVPAAKLHTAETSTSLPRGVMFDQYSTGTNSSRLYLRKSRGTFGSKSTIVTGDAIGNMTFSAYDGTQFTDGADFLVTSIGTISSGIVPATMQLRTANSSGTLTAGVTIDEAQKVGLVNVTTLTRNNLVTTPEESMILANTQAATSGVPAQISPGLLFSSFGWKTNSTAASQSVKVLNSVLSVQGTANPSGVWKLTPNINAGGYSTDMFSVTTGGVGVIPTQFVVGPTSGNLRTDIVPGQIVIANNAGTPVATIGNGLGSGSILRFTTASGYLFGTSGTVSIADGSLSSGMTLQGSATVSIQTFVTNGTSSSAGSQLNVGKSIYSGRFWDGAANVTRGHQWIASASTTTNLVGSMALQENITTGSYVDVIKFTNDGHTVISTNDLSVKSFSPGYVAKTANYTIADGDYLINCTANSFTVTLPTAVGIPGRQYVVKNTGTLTTITIATTSSQTVDGAAPGTITTLTPYRVMSDGANWITY